MEKAAKVTETRPTWFAQVAFAALVVAVALAVWLSARDRSGDGAIGREPQSAVSGEEQERLTDVALAACVSFLADSVYETAKYRTSDRASVRVWNVVCNVKPRTVGIRGGVAWADGKGDEATGDFVVTVLDGRVIDTRIRRVGDAEFRSSGR